FLRSDPAEKKQSQCYRIWCSSFLHLHRVAAEAGAVLSFRPVEGHVRGEKSHGNNPRRRFHAGFRKVQRKRGRENGEYRARFSRRGSSWNGATGKFFSGPGNFAQFPMFL